MANNNPYAKRWCFTYNNPTHHEQEVIDLLDSLEAEYIVFQLEEGAEGTPHYQGFVCFFQKRRLSQIRHLFPGHFSVARGTVAQNRAYCTKQEGRIGEFSEFGIPPEEKGARTDLNELHSRLQAGTLTNKQYANEHFPLFIKYPNLVQNYELSQIEGRNDGCEISCVLLVGFAGTGKSYLASKMARELGLGGVYRHSLGKWWDGYRGERITIFDDFRGHSLSITDFKLVFDRYALRIQVKGSSCPLAATHFFITTNIDPKDWWKEELFARENDAITRRFTKVLYFEEFGRFMEFPDYATYASLILTPLRDGQVRPALPPTQEVVFI